MRLLAWKALNEKPYAATCFHIPKVCKAAAKKHDLVSSQGIEGEGGAMVLQSPIARFFAPKKEGSSPPQTPAQRAPEPKIETSGLEAR